MGNNITVVVYTDAISDIKENAQEFCDELAASVNYSNSNHPTTLCAGGCTAGQVVELHHADDICLVAVGGNTGRPLANYRPKSSALGRSVSIEAIKAIMRDHLIELEDLDDRKFYNWQVRCSSGAGYSQLVYFYANKVFLKEGHSLDVDGRIVTLPGVIHDISKC